MEMNLRLATFILLVLAAAAVLWRPSRLASGRVWLGVLLALNAVLVAGVWLGPLFPGAPAIIFGVYALSPLVLLIAMRRLNEPKVIGRADALILVPAAVVATLAALGWWGWALMALHGTALVAFGLAIGPFRRSGWWIQILFAVFVVHWGFSMAAGLSGFLGWAHGDLFVTLSLATLLAFGLGAAAAGLKYVAARLPEVATFGESRPADQHELALEDVALCAKLRTLFEQDSIHLDPDLTLEVLALCATAEPRDVSRVLNSVLGGGYHDVVRRYRVDRAKELLLSDRDATILSVLHASGFNSKSAFHRAFSEQVGLTPSEWRRIGQAGRPTS